MYPGADIAGAERIRGDRINRDIDRSTRLQRIVKRTGSGRLDADHPDAAGEPGGDAGNQTATADRDQNRIEIGRLLRPFQADGALAGDVSSES